jgi:hypothetical protein
MSELLSTLRTRVADEAFCTAALASKVDDLSLGMTPSALAELGVLITFYLEAQGENPDILIQAKRVEMTVSYENREFVHGVSRRAESAPVRYYAAKHVNATRLNSQEDEDADDEFEEEYAFE